MIDQTQIFKQLPELVPVAAEINPNNGDALCCGCYFDYHGGCAVIACSSKDRTDGQHVIFKLKEKVLNGTT